MRMFFEPMRTVIIDAVEGGGEEVLVGPVVGFFADYHHASVHHHTETLFFPAPDPSADRLGDI